MKLAATALALSALAGCGYIGNPLPPTLDIPSPTVDLRAREYGGNLQVEFSIPPLTTEGVALKEVRSAEVLAGASQTPFNAPVWARTAKAYPAMANMPGPAALLIPAQEWAGQTIVLEERATGPKGKISGFSNPVVLAVAPPLPTPATLQAENAENGVRLTWTGSGPKYRVYRESSGGQPMQIAETEKPEYVDSSAQFGMEYRYLVMSLADEAHTSVLSAPSAPVTPKDVFPPAVPSGVTAVAGINTIELAWERNTEPDFKGYNVFRSADGGPLEKIASLIEAPTFSDSKVQAGHSYRYAISSVDLLGNESARSAAVTAALP